MSPPDIKNLMPIIGMVTRLDNVFLAKMLQVLGMEQLADQVRSVDRLALIRKLASGSLEHGKDITGDEVTLLVLCCIAGMREAGSSPAEIREAVEGYVSQDMTREFLDRLRKGGTHA